MRQGYASWFLSGQNAVEAVKSPSGRCGLLVFESRGMKGPSDPGQNRPMHQIVKSAKVRGLAFPHAKALISSSVQFTWLCLLMRQSKTIIAARWQTQG